MSSEQARASGKHTSEFLVIILSMAVNVGIVILARYLNIPLEDFKEAILGNSLGAGIYAGGRSFLKAKAVN